MYLNYGDTNVLAGYGRLLERVAKHEFNIITIDPIGEDLYKVCQCYVYDKDKIIDKEDVASFILLDEYDPCSFAVGCVDLYGPEAFCNFKNRYTMNKDEVFEFLKKFSYDPETTVICD